MGKIKERKSESWKPNTIQDSSFISKNKKRKARRMSQVSTSTTTELKKVADLMAVGTKPSTKKIDELKSNGNANQSFSSAPKTKKKNVEFLSTSLPVSVGKLKKGKQSFSPFSKKKVGQVLSDSQTPKRKATGKVTFETSPISEKLIEDEAVEVKKPVTDKETKPFPTKKRNKLPRDSSDDNEDVTEDGAAFLDLEASEGEETDEESAEDSDSEDSDSGDEMSDNVAFMADDNNSEEEESDTAAFLAEDGSSEEENEHETENENESEDDNDEDDENAMETEVTDLKGKENKNKTKPLSETRKPVAMQVAVEKKSTAVKLEKTVDESAKKGKKQSSLEKKQMKSTKVKSENDIEANKENMESVEKSSSFVGFIGNLPQKYDDYQYILFLPFLYLFVSSYLPYVLTYVYFYSISEKQIKNSLRKSTNVANILKLSLATSKKRKDNKQRCLVYVKDEDALNVSFVLQFYGRLLH